MSVFQLSSKNMLVSIKLVCFYILSKALAFSKITKCVDICPLEGITAKMCSAQFFNYFLIADRLEIIPIDKHYEK